MIKSFFNIKRAFGIFRECILCKIIVPKKEIAFISVCEGDVGSFYCRKCAEARNYISHEKKSPIEPTFREIIKDTYEKNKEKLCIQ